MAVFLLKAKHGSTYVPPACTGDFADVACPSPFADWIEQLAAEGITGGCGGGNYCPAESVTPRPDGGVPGQDVPVPVDRPSARLSLRSREGLVRSRLSRGLALCRRLGCSPRASAATFTVTTTADSRRRVAAPGDPGRQRATPAPTRSRSTSPGAGVHTIALATRLPPRSPARHDRRLHAAGRLAEHAAGRPGH